MLILFDIDMTLLSSSHIGIDCLRDAGRSLFNPDFTVEGVVFGGGIDPLILQEMLLLNEIDPSQINIDSLRSTYHEILTKIANERTVAEPLPGAHELVNATASHHTQPTLGLLTGNYQETGTIKVVSAGFDPSIFTINAWGDCSPHKEPKRSHLPPVAIERYQRVKNMTLNPQSVIVIGDTIHDVSCAKVNGCRSLAVATGHDDADTLRDAGADRVVEDLTQTEELIEWLMHS